MVFSFFESDWRGVADGEVEIHDKSLTGAVYESWRSPGAGKSGLFRYLPRSLTEHLEGIEGNKWLELTLHAVFTPLRPTGPDGLRHGMQCDIDGYG